MVVCFFVFFRLSFVFCQHVHVSVLCLMVEETRSLDEFSSSFSSSLSSSTLDETNRTNFACSRCVVVDVLKLKTQFLYHLLLQAFRNCLDDYVSKFLPILELSFCLQN